MRYVKTLESLKEDKEELEQFKEMINMIFVDLIDEGFYAQIRFYQRVKKSLKPLVSNSFYYETYETLQYKKCNVVYVRLMRFKDDNDSLYDNSSEEFKHKITDCFETLLALLERRWNGAKIEKIVREDAVTSNDTNFSVLDERIWSRDFITISISIAKDKI
jgi:Asp-tRNA(Asn)/Glu-tRNA(Gln) amidotransferase C subunit